MRVVYRMRGLLGDATEEFVETLTAKSEQEVDNEEVYKMANVMADCGGLQVGLMLLTVGQLTSLHYYSEFANSKFIIFDINIIITKTNIEALFFRIVK